MSLISMGGKACQAEGKHVQRLQEETCTTRLRNGKEASMAGTESRCQSSRR